MVNGLREANLEHLVLQTLLHDLCCRDSQHVIDLALRQSVVGSPPTTHPESVESVSRICGQLVLSLRRPVDEDLALVQRPVRVSKEGTTFEVIVAVRLELHGVCP